MCEHESQDRMTERSSRRPRINLVLCLITAFINGEGNRRPEVAETVAFSSPLDKLYDVMEWQHVVLAARPSLAAKRTAGVAAAGSSCGASLSLRANTGCTCVAGPVSCLDNAFVGQHQLVKSRRLSPADRRLEYGRE